MVAKKRSRTPARKRPTTRSERSSWSVEDDGLDGAVVDVAGGQAVLTPIAVKRLPDHERALVGNLYVMSCDRRQMDVDIADAVQELREHGVSWGVLGYALGTSSQAARQRFGDPS